MADQPSIKDQSHSGVPAASPPWVCTACGEVHRGTVQPSLDPRWAIARCTSCRKRGLMAHESFAPAAVKGARSPSTSRRTTR